MLSNFLIFAIYEADNNNDNVDLMDSGFLNNIIELDMDKEIVEPTTNYTFKSQGYHSVYVTMNITNLSSLNYMFIDLKKLISISFTKNFDTQNIREMELMFYNNHKIKTIDISYFNLERIQSMRTMFYGCTSLTLLKLPNCKTPHLEDMGNMFYGCSNLTSIDLSNFYVESVTDLVAAFYNCYSLTHVNLSNFYTYRVTDMRFLFYNCYKYKYFSFYYTKFKRNGLYVLWMYFFNFN